MPPGRPRKNQRNVLMKSAELIGWAIGGIERGDRSDAQSVWLR